MYVRADVPDSMVSAETLSQVLLQTLACLICKEMVREAAQPVVPQCCKGVTICTGCLAQWLEENNTCQHCRQELQACSPLPMLLLCPMFDLVY